MKKILVTGGAGFVGSNLSERLLKDGHKVVVVDNLITGSENNIRYLSKYPKFTFVKHDICESFAPVNRELLTVNQIYHLACPTGVDNLVTFAFEMIQTCSAGTQNVLDLARKNKAQLVFTSSSEVYGDPQAFPQNEAYNGNVDPGGVRSPYEEGKRFSESLISAYVRAHNVDARIARVFNTYGQGMSQSDNRAIPLFLRQALTNGEIPVHGEGLQTRTFCFIDDLTEGLTTIMEKGEKGEVYNLGGDVEVKIIDLAKLIINVTNSKSKIKFIARPSHDHQGRRPDLTKIKKLGWVPKTNLKEGLIKTIKW